VSFFDARVRKLSFTSSRTSSRSVSSMSTTTMRSRPPREAKCEFPTGQQRLPLVQVGPATRAAERPCRPNPRHQQAWANCRPVALRPGPSLPRDEAPDHGSPADRIPRCAANTAAQRLSVPGRYPCGHGVASIWRTECDGLARGSRRQRPVSGVRNPAVRRALSPSSTRSSQSP
jgi:hypothetical protein